MTPIVTSNRRKTINRSVSWSSLPVWDESSSSHQKFIKELLQLSKFMLWITAFILTFSVFFVYGQECVCPLFKQDLNKQLCII
jgi:hypothetical protein